jgi:hypothetical protein
MSSRSTESRSSSTSSCTDPAYSEYREPSSTTESYAKPTNDVGYELPVPVNVAYQAPEPTCETTTPSYVVTSTAPVASAAYVAPAAVSAEAYVATPAYSAATAQYTDSTDSSQPIISSAITLVTTLALAVVALVALVF